MKLGSQMGVLIATLLAAPITANAFTCVVNTEYPTNNPEYIYWNPADYTLCAGTTSVYWIWFYQSGSSGPKTPLTHVLVCDSSSCKDDATAGQIRGASTLSRYIPSVAAVCDNVSEIASQLKALNNNTIPRTCYCDLPTTDETPYEFTRVNDVNYATRIAERTTKIYYTGRGECKANITTEYACIEGYYGTATSDFFHSCSRCPAVTSASGATVYGQNSKSQSDNGMTFYFDDDEYVTDISACKINKATCQDEAGTYTITGCTATEGTGNVCL